MLAVPSVTWLHFSIHLSLSHSSTVLSLLRLPLCIIQTQTRSTHWYYKILKYPKVFFVVSHPCTNIRSIYFYCLLSWQCADYFPRDKDFRLPNAHHNGYYFLHPLLFVKCVFFFPVFFLQKKGGDRSTCRYMLGLSIPLISDVANNKE